MSDLLVIPARFGSTRLPGKPLVRIAGHTLLARVVRVAQCAAALAGDCDVVVATDDHRIARHAEGLGCEVAMTAAEIGSGSGRACAVAIGRDPRPGIVVNLQGDAPFVPPAMVAALIATARHSSAACVTPVIRLDWSALDAMRAHKARSPFSGTTCVRDAEGRALWFSKTILPAIREEATLRMAGPLSPVFRHLGLYAYRLDALERFEATPPTTHERLEGLEQLRFLEMGLFIQTVAVEPPTHAMSGIDTAEDVALAEQLIARFGDPHAA
ncbi:3-deoxy-manno-octulosonate cytidylyltransferase (CMP-KDO synthetase) [Sphingomonas gellani]|uniref:3-deoxy-manno-octulosonate cytidylyltransferase (CMP-KDO synthetase) n=1 Tax=Sphingomonas gellani TaxID=1166340 RepID=A0A1H8I863_9SPHN|nr:manno-octulosonate cytidylyltransferase [Sphingomonas gellani]SEN64452.1 3-deoxy-manno-octulosonate cytidylyltransferase (CMP-KDO synthetase) [Sphingomonas gellani]